MTDVRKYGFKASRVRALALFNICTGSVIFPVLVYQALSHEDPYAKFVAAIWALMLGVNIGVNMGLRAFYQQGEIQ